MNPARKNVRQYVSESFEANVEPAGKAVENLPAEPARSSSPPGEPQETGHSGESTDIWMENVRKFIRDIDVKSL